MDVQHACLCKIINDGDILPFIEAKITDVFFPDDKHLKVWQLVTDHFKKFGKAPDEAAVHKAYPTYKVEDYPEPTSYYLNQLRQDRKKVILATNVQKFVSRFTDEDEGPDIGDELEGILRKGLAEAAHEISQGRDTDFFPSYERAVDRLRERKDNPSGLRGIPTGFATLDYLTGGYQPEQLITLIGTPKAGKSSILLRSALHTRLASNSRVLLLTFEMSTEEQEDRLMSLLSGVGLTKILNGTVTNKEFKQVEDALTVRQGLHGFVITSDITSATTLSGVYAKAQQYQPDIIFVDGAYLMDPEGNHDKGSPQHLTELTRGFKRMAQTLRLPIVITTQALLSRSRNGLTADSIGYSSSFAQDSDGVYGVRADERVRNVSKLSVILQRSGPTGSAYVETIWDQGRIEEIDRADYEAAAAKAASSGGGKSSGSNPGSTVGWDDDAAA